MPGLTVALNGEAVVAVSTEGRSLVDVRVHGDVISPEFAFIDVSGGTYRDGESLYLTWLNQQNLSPGDELDIQFVELVHDSGPGKTIEELFPGEPELMGPCQPLIEAFERLAREPKIREGFRFHLEGPVGEFAAATQPGEHSFGFSVNWNSFRPERARVSLSSNTLDNIAKRSGGTDHAMFFLNYGQRVRFRVDA